MEGKGELHTDFPILSVYSNSRIVLIQDIFGIIVKEH